MLCVLTKCIWSVGPFLRSCMKSCRVTSKWGLMRISLHFLPPAQWSSDPQPNPKPEKPHSLPFGKVTGQESFMRGPNKNRLCLLKNCLQEWRHLSSMHSCFCHWLTSKQFRTNQSLQSMIEEWKKFKYSWFPSSKCSISFASAPISPSARPMKLNVGVSAGQCRPESIYLHTSTGVIEARLWANHILVSLKSLFHQTWVNGLLMDMQRQVLFLLAGGLDKKPKATAWLKAILLTKHFSLCKSIEWQKPFLYIYLVFVIQS